MALSATLASPAAADPTVDDALHSSASLEGVWRNAKDSVRVEVRTCAAALCGYVTFATAKAQADARRGGTENLVGLKLLKSLTPGPPGVWLAKVLVPDLNATFSGTARLLGPNTLKVQGCLVIGIFCKSQEWTRAQAANLSPALGIASQQGPHLNPRRPSAAARSAGR